MDESQNDGRNDSLNPKIYARFENLFNGISKIRKRPLLVMFYSDNAGQIMPYDIAALEEVIDGFLKNKSKSGFTELDLLIHTHGGEAHTSYRLIQLIRSYCKKLNVLVATHSHSGGTLIAFGADKIEMGRSGTLSPIDIQIDSGNGIFSLLSIEKYLEFLENTSKLHGLAEGNKTGYITELTKELTREVCPSRLGELFRLRSLTELHAKTLLYNYMLKNNSNKEAIANQIIAKFTKESPTHHFLMDYELVAESGLNVEKMDNKVYKLAIGIINVLAQLKRAGVVCPFYPGSTNKRRPFFMVFDVAGENRNEKE